MRPTLVSALSLLATTALAAPPFVLQPAGDRLAAPLEPASQQQQQQHHHHDRVLPDLSVDDFIAVENSLTDSLKHALGQVVDEVKALPHPPHHPLPPPVLDFTKYTILEIVNATYKKPHHEPDHFDGAAFARKLRKGLALGGDEGDDSEHHPSPEHLPLNHLAWLINFSPEAAALLEKDDITLLAPDNHALQNPHKRKDPGGKFANLGDAARDGSSALFDLTAAAPHPFHSRELSPKKLAKLADSDDEDDDEKKRILKKIIAYVGKYHVFKGKWHAHELADRSTLPTLVEESRVRVEPTLDLYPYPHPSLKFNSYAHKRGPTILARNGVIHLIGEPLLPPFGPVNQLFLAPKFFGLFTNAAQKVEMTHKGDDSLLAQASADDALLSGDLSDLDFDDLLAELTDEHKDKDFTVFVPSNFAFARLPLKVAAFLHSPFPFAKRVLKYLLGYHVVPDLVFFSDYVKNGSSADVVAQYAVKTEVDVEVPMTWLVPAEHGRFEGPPPYAPEHPPYGRANVTHYVLPTLLTEINPNATLKVAVISHRFLGKGPVRREIIIFPSLPPHHDHDHHDHKHDHEHDDNVSAPYRRFGCGHEHDGPPRPHPVKVAYTDLPVRAGAVHVLGTQFLLPPPPSHDKHLRALAEASGFGFSKLEAKKVGKLLARMSAA
ncbi:uncharacterized protein RHOBADRAFT_53467 [Rhodotorula graminis WP1]|uniref:FAS1 domain-containing protein n=1 Tax=Rhodotorula graminis (strain WP1) TaxID=578459 RepID=A0A194S4Q4_RHOGW|nr:uncharacterized protein RHOBADRAFT_53467 [Rhodotorula graminis WP1]KPV75495.1 hypothetical protein RHOBADRAFT_53467 [Rhodotorula graminis WP1]